MEGAIAASWQLVPAIIVIVRWFRNPDVIIIMFEVFFTSSELL
jgi:hypothetical protein